MVGDGCNFLATICELHPTYRLISGPIEMRLANYLAAKWQKVPSDRKWSDEHPGAVQVFLQRPQMSIPPIIDPPATVTQ